MCPAARTGTRMSTTRRTKPLPAYLSHHIHTHTHAHKHTEKKQSKQKTQHRFAS